MQTLFDRVTHAHWFLLLLPDSADDWGWQLYEAGIFRGSMLPGDRLICLHHPDVQLAPQLKDYQAVPAKQDAVIKFLDDILVQPDAVPGMDPLNKNARELADLAGDIVSAFDNLSAVETVWFGNFVELAVDNAEKLTRAEDLNRARIITRQGVEELFGRQRGVDQTWGALTSDLEGSTDTAWITELVDVIRSVAKGGLPPSMEATFAGANGGAGKQFRPRLTSVKKKDGSIECFHISFIEVLGRGTAGEEPAGMRSLQTAMRLAYRFRWEIIEPYRYKARLAIKDIQTIENILERLEREAQFHGLLDRGILCSQFGPDAHAVDEMYTQWEEIRNDQRTGLLDQGFVEKDGRKVKEFAESARGHQQALHGSSREALRGDCSQPMVIVSERAETPGDLEKACDRHCEPAGAGGAIHFQKAFAKWIASLHSR